MHCHSTTFGWPELEDASPKPRGFLRYAQSSPGHPTSIPGRHKAPGFGKICRWMAIITIVKGTAIVANYQIASRRIFHLVEVSMSRGLLAFPSR